MEACLSYQNSYRQSSKYLTPLYEWRPHGDSKAKILSLAISCISACKHKVNASILCLVTQRYHIQYNHFSSLLIKTRLTNSIRISTRNSGQFGDEKSGFFQVAEARIGQIISQLLSHFEKFSRGRK